MERVIPTRSRSGTLAARVLASLGVLASLCGSFASTALANDLSTNPCTAGDVEIIGPGIVINEPCECTPGGTFTADVMFTVRNNTSTGRYCIALHLVPDDQGIFSQPLDIILTTTPGGNNSTALGKSGGDRFRDTVMFGRIQNFPCNVGKVCFGQAGVIRGKCSPGTCTTIAWDTTPNAAGCTTANENPPGGQCRHQQVCVIGYGAALECIQNCTPDCGGESVLKASVDGGTPPYVYVLEGSDGSSETYPSSGATNDTSHNFAVTVDGPTTYTLSVTDSEGCERTAMKLVSASPLAKPTFTAGKPDCEGKTTLTASPSDLARYEWFRGATSIGTGNPLMTTLAPGDHSITVKVTSSARCEATSDPTNVHVNTRPVAENGDAAVDCDGNVTLTAGASGGTGTGFTFEWFENGQSIGTGSPLTLKLDPGNHAITVKATDSDGCTSHPLRVPVMVNEPVAVSASAGKPDCDGKTTLTATASGGTGGFTYEWFENGQPIGTGNPLMVTLAPGNHSITVKVTDGDGCTKTSDPTNVQVNDPVSTSLDTGSAPDCLGNLTFTASATGGTGSYTFAWTVDGVPVAGVTGPTLASLPKVDCKPHVVAVKATDSDGCPSGNTASRTVTQVVTTTVN